LDDLGVPNDVEAGILALRSDFPVKECEAWKIPPLVFRAQLYGILADRSQVDMELDRLRERGTVRVFKFQGWSGDIGIMWTSDYLAMVEQLIASAKADADQDALRQFAECVRHRPSWRKLGLVLDDLNDVACVRDVAERAAIQHGLLICYGDEGYRFSIANVGRLLLARESGAKGLLRFLRRKPYGEAPLDELEKFHIRASPFGTRFHLRDVVGLDLVEILDTNAGSVIRSTPAAEVFLENKRRVSRT